METLFILSDLWGSPRSEWTKEYISRLERKFQIEYLDCTELAGLNLSSYTQDALHKQFVNGGIEQGVLNLMERITTETTILAFSVGGTIAWQCALNSPYVKKLVCVSSTRLRKEEEKPASETVLIFGEQDEFAPKKAWFEKMEVTPKVIPMMPHDMYKELEVAQLVAAML